VKDDPAAAKLDLVFDEYLDRAAESEGCAGATRLLCKTEWDYKLLLKFEDIDSLKVPSRCSHSAKRCVPSRCSHSAKRCTAVARSLSSPPACHCNVRSCT